MNFLKAPIWRKLCIICICLLLSLGNFSSISLAQPYSEITLAVTQANQSRLLNASHLFTNAHSSLAFIFQIFRRKPKDRDGAPEGRRPAGRRGPCNDLNRTFVALVPRVDASLVGADLPDLLDGLAVGFTAQVRPTAFVYLPELPDALLATGVHDFTAQFMVQQLRGQDEVDLLEEEISMSIPFQGGIAAISFEALGITLDPNEAYHWYLSIVCDRERPSRNPSVDAWTEIVDVDDRRVIESQISVIPDTMREIQFYIEQELWHETVTLLATLRCQEPDNPLYKEALKELLTTLFLDDKSGADITVKVAEAVEQQQCPIQLRAA